MLHRKQYRVAAGVTIMALALTLTACGTQENTGSTESVKSTETVENTETVKGTETVESTETIENAEIIGAMVLESVVPQGTANVTPQMQPVEYTNLQQITLDPDWEYADHSKINTGAAVLYRAPEESGRKGIVIGVNAGHGTVGGSKVKTLCHPDGSAKVTGGSTAAGAMEAAAVSGGMTFQDGTPEREVTLRMAQILRDKLLSSGYDVLMLRDLQQCGGLPYWTVLGQRRRQKLRQGMLLHLGAGSTEKHGAGDIALAAARYPGNGSGGRTAGAGSHNLWERTYGY